MKYRYAILFFLVAFLIQSAGFTGLFHGRLMPDLILCLVLLMAFLYRGNQGLVLGVAFGLISDLAFSSVIGPSSIAYFLVALFAAELKNYWQRDSILSILIVVVTGTGIFNVLLWGTRWLFGGIHPFFQMVEALPLLFLYHGMIAVLFYLLVGRRTIRHPQDRYYRRMGSTFG